MATEEKQIVTTTTEISPVSLGAPMTLLRVTEMATLVQQVSERLFQDGTHYGKVPGTSKNTLFQAGAQKLALVFHLSPSFECERLNLANDHREYIVTATLKSNGQFIAEGVGSCSTMESKYRYRNAELGFTPTGNLVPQSYWKLKQPQEKKRAIAQIMDDATGRFDVRKVNGVWNIVRLNDGEMQKVEHPNIADVYNTVLKMSKKRAYVDAILNATGASDTFTQDLEELEENVDALRAYEAEHTSTRHDARESEHEEPEAQTTQEPKKTPQRQSSNRQEANKEQSEPVGMDWRKTVCHLGSVKGRKLGDLTLAHLRTIKSWADGKDFTDASLQDKKLKLAVELGIAELTKDHTEQQEFAHPQDRKEEIKKEIAKAVIPAKEEDAAEEEKEFVFAKPEELPEEKQESEQVPDVGISEENEDYSEELDRLRKNVAAEAMTEEEFIQSAKANKAIPSDWPGTNLDDLDEGSLVAFFVAKWDELMIQWGERKPVKPPGKKK